MPKRKVILSCAITGVLATRKQCPAIPYTPEEIALEAKRAYEAGATIAHVHAREDDGSPSWRMQLFSEIKERIGAYCPIVVNFSTGGIGNSIEERARPALQLKPGIAAVNMGSMNYAIWSRQTKSFHLDTVFQNPFREIEWLIRGLGEVGVVPELECFDAGHICNADPFIEMGLLHAPMHFSLIMGVCGGIKATRRCLENQISILPDKAQFQVIGIGRQQWELARWGLELGGHLRVGLEDNFYLRDGVSMAKSNAELCCDGVRLIEELGCVPTTIEETISSYRTSSVQSFQASSHPAAGPRGLAPDATPRC